MNNPHYLKSKNSIENDVENAIDAVESIRVAELDLNVPLKILGQKRSDQYFKSTTNKENFRKKSKKKKHKSER